MDDKFSTEYLSIKFVQLNYCCKKIWQPMGPASADHSPSKWTHRLSSYFFCSLNSNPKWIVFCRNIGWLMKNIVKGLSVEKWVMINHPKIPQMPKLSTQAKKGFNSWFGKVWPEKNIHCYELEIKFHHTIVDSNPIQKMILFHC